MPDRNAAGRALELTPLDAVVADRAAVVAGQLIAPLGLLPVIVGWTVLIVALAALGLIIQLRRPRVAGTSPSTT